MDAAGWLEAQARRLAARLWLACPNDPALRAMVEEAHGAGVDAATITAYAERADREVDAADGAPPLLALAGALRLSLFELDLVVCALLGELDEGFGDVFARARGGASLRRPTFGLAVGALAPRAARAGAFAMLRRSALWSHGLLREGDRDVALPDREIVATEACTAAAFGVVPDALGEARIRPEPTTTAALTLSCRPSWSAVVDDLAHWITRVGPGIVHLAGADPGGRRALAACLAHRLGQPLLRVGPLAESAREALREVPVVAWTSAALVAVELAPDARRMVVPEGWRTPLPSLVLTGPEVEIEVSPELPFRRVTPPVPRPAEQAAAWRALLDGVPTALLANRTRLPLDQMARAATMARDRAASRGEATPTEADALAAVLDVVRPPPNPLAELRRPEVAWSSLVVGTRTRTTLEDMVGRVRHRVTVQDDWGLRGHGGRGEGLVALLHGESGTGKTLAAEALATQLGLPLLHVDLARVVSKYIGETEKNLGAVFDAGEGFGALLFFDEADALFSRRTAVGDSHDRWANLETNYLLQRLERFEGVAVLATNLLQNLDDAFVRRIPYQIHFPRPGRAQQRQLWERHLPAGRLAADVDLDLVVQRHDLVGGDIKNAATAAAYAAASAEGVVTQAMVLAAVREELIKKGRPV